VTAARPDPPIEISDAPIEITVPHQNRPLEPPSPERIRRLRRHLVESLRDLRSAKRPDRMVRPRAPAELGSEQQEILRAGCSACQGHCCLGGGEHAWLDERTMARVRREQPELSPRALIAAYVRQIAEVSYAGSCLFHGIAGCTLDATLRAALCFDYYCDGLRSFLNRSPNQPRSNPRVVFRFSQR
jgi:hypothetical protein